MARPLVYAHIGDLHIDHAADQNYADFLLIASQLETEFAGKLDFVYLPGDVADHALRNQYRLVAAGLKMLSMPVYSVAGDHDMEGGDLDLFYEILGGQRLPFRVSINGASCYFLDVCGPGKGGPDFRLGREQLEWLERELCGDGASSKILFMHTYPDDLKDDSEKRILLEIVSRYKILLVDMGHTHYNEISNDGQTIYAATRSTGQIEEGPVGYTLVGIHDGLISWRFRNLADPFPFVLITKPVDRRLRRDNHPQGDETVVVSAQVFGDRSLKQVVCFFGDGVEVPMSLHEDGSWNAQVKADHARDFRLTVLAVDEWNRKGSHSIEVTVPGESRRTRNGSDLDSIGAWPENGILGTQLGPNRNGQPGEVLRKERMNQRP